MRNGDEQVYPQDSFGIPQNGEVRQYPTWGVPISNFGMNLRTKIIIELMPALIMKTDGLIYTPDEIANKACEYAEALLRRMP